MIKLSRFILTVICFFIVLACYGQVKQYSPLDMLQELRRINVYNDSLGYFEKLFALQEKLNLKPKLNFRYFQDNNFVYLIRDEQKMRSNVEEVPSIIRSIFIIPRKVDYIQLITLQYERYIHSEKDIETFIIVTIDCPNDDIYPRIRVNLDDIKIPFLAKGSDQGFIWGIYRYNISRDIIAPKMLNVDNFIFDIGLIMKTYY